MPSVLSAEKYLRELSGWKRLLAAFLFGSVMALAMPPVGLFPVLWICIPAAIFLLQGTHSGWQAFGTGWSFAFGFFVFGLYWIAASMFVDIKTFWWAVPLAVAGLPALFAIYYGVAAIVARKLGLEGLGGAIAFALTWFLADWARGHLFTGFPWNLIGYAWSGQLAVLQVTSIIGIYGLSLLTVIAAALPVALKDKSRTARTAVSASILMFAAFAVWGEHRLRTTEVVSAPGVYIRLVQPNVDQKKKWVLDEREEHFQELISLTSKPSEKPITHFFWPETASTYYLSEDPFKRKQIADTIPASSAVITGVVRRTANENGTIKYYNSLVALDGLGNLVAGYDKAHLVPFGEYMPFRKHLPIPTIVQNSADFSAGPGPRSLRVRGLPLFSPLICYEAIFPGKVIDYNDRPDFLLNITNDGWYGRTAGPYQHFAIARTRTIEEGLPLVRVANTGISGIVDPLGRVAHALELGQQGIVDGDLPQPIRPTFYSRMQETPTWIFFFLFLGSFSKRLKNFWSKKH
ncbi:MAG: apolipoprotein N-acyltransferase [Alphaproteobacteria bacterium]|nr:apolipoprotein N-acyltransferase [Alphaproteobacteria bacterium]